MMLLWQSDGDIGRIVLEFIVGSRVVSNKDIGQSIINDEFISILAIRNLTAFSLVVSIVP